MEIENKYKDKTAFVLGSGPSLRKVDVKLLEPHITIAVNSSILKAPSAQFFLCCEHGITLFKSWLALKDLNCKILLHKKAGMTIFEEATGIKVFEGIDRDRILYFVFKEENLIMDKISEELRLIRCSSSIHSAVHFAHILGCNPIVLLGCDCCYEDGKYHFYDFPGEVDEGYIRPEFEQLKPQYTFPVSRRGNSDEILMGHLACWEKIRKQNPNVNIINASEGLMNVFPRMSIKKILKKYKV